MAKKNVRNMKVCGQSGYKYETVPAITLKGKWLEELGFHLGDYVQVKCENGQMIITPDVNKAQEQEAKTAFMDEEMENGRGTVDVGDCIASVSGQAMAAGEAWDGKLEVEDYTTRFAIGGGLDVNVFRDSLSMQMKETVNRGFEVYFAERAGISGFCRPVEMEGV